MSKTARCLTVSLAAIITALSLSAMAQPASDQRPPNRPAPPNRAAPPAPQPRSGAVQNVQPYRAPVGPPAGGPQYRAPVVQGTQQYRGPVSPVQGAQQYRAPVQGAQQYRGASGAPQG